MARRSILALCIALASAPVALADCIQKPPTLLEVKILSCEAPDALARERFKTNGAEIIQGHTVESMLKATPARVITLRPVRYREPAMGASWRPWDRGDDFRALVLGPPDCRELTAGASRVFLDQSVCCDTGIADLTCLLRLPVFERPKHDLLESSGVVKP